MAHVPSGDDNEIKQSAQLLEQIRSYHLTFSRFQEKAKSAADSLTKERDSTPAQCSRFLSPLFQYDGYIATFCNVLQQPHLPDHINEKRHEVLIAFQKIEPSLDRVKQCRDAFASGSSYSQGEEARAQRTEILNATLTLGQHLSAFNGLLGAILNAPSPPGKIGSDKNFDYSSENAEEQHKQRTELMPTDHADLSERQQSPLFMRLYELLKMYTDDLALREICRIVGATYNLLNGDSHAAKAFSLAEQLDNENRLQVLEEELRRRLPGRFQEPSPGQ